MILPLTLCPACGYAMDDATGLTTDRRPSAGDIGICLSCGAMLMYAGDGRPDRALSGEEEQRYASPLTVEAQRIIRQRGPLPDRTRK
jgi:hypothetical protein